MKIIIDKSPKCLLTELWHLLSLFLPNPRWRFLHSDIRATKGGHLHVTFTRDIFSERNLVTNHHGSLSSHSESGFTIPTQLLRWMDWESRFISAHLFTFIGNIFNRKGPYPHEGGWQTKTWFVLTLYTYREPYSLSSHLSSLTSATANQDTS